MKYKENTFKYRFLLIWIARLENCCICFSSIVFGFSFADEHIREIVKRSIINPSLKVFVICYDASTREKISSMFQDVPTDNIEYLPYSFENNQDGQDLEIHGNFDYLNFLFGDISNG